MYKQISNFTRIVNLLSLLPTYLQPKEHIASEWMKTDTGIQVSLPVPDSKDIQKHDDVSIFQVISGLKNAIIVHKNFYI